MLTLTAKVKQHAQANYSLFNVVLIEDSVAVLYRKAMLAEMCSPDDYLCM